MKLSIFVLTANVFLIGMSRPIHAQTSYIQSLSKRNTWVEKKIKKLSKKERIAQLFFIRALSNQDKRYNDSLVKLVKNKAVGGVIFFQGGPSRQANLTNRLQNAANIPLLIAMDAEWGVGMRLDSTVLFPYQMALGAIQNQNLIEIMGKSVAEDFNRLGMHMNFAPDIDINNNPKNPVINYRSFGENKENVAKKATAYMRGMQSKNILTSLKHFPGHGDTEVDSHVGLPNIPHSKDRLMNTEIYPFYQLINQGASGVMVAHLNIPSLDNTPNIPSTLSYPIITDLLKTQLGFKGLVITDAMEMKAIAKAFAPGIADLKAIEAGNDIIELSEDVHLAIKTILKKARIDKNFMNRIDESVRKILLAKYWAQDTLFQPVNLNNIYTHLNKPSKIQLQNQLAEAAITIIKGREYINQLRFEKRTALLNISPSGQANTFQNELKVVYNAQVLNLKSNENSSLITNTLLSNLKNYTQIIVCITDERARPATNLPLSNEVEQLIGQISTQLATHLVIFANPYCVDELPKADKAKSITIAYQKENFMQQATSKIFQKKIIAKGILPVSINAVFKSGLELN